MTSLYHEKLKFFPELVSTVFEIKYQANPKLINYGSCMKWAYVAYHMFKGLELWDTNCHAFVKYKGKFYDSETLGGVSDWRELKTNRDYPEVATDARRRTKKLFEQWWA